jgi:hypothetical protein
MIVFVGFLSCKPTATTISGLSTTINPHGCGRIQCPLLCLSMWALLLHPVYLYTHNTYTEYQWIIILIII